jgi:hypothetical protein
LGNSLAILWRRRLAGVLAFSNLIDNADAFIDGATKSLWPATRLALSFPPHHVIVKNGN